MWICSNINKRLREAVLIVVLGFFILATHAQVNVELQDKVDELESLISKARVNPYYLHTDNTAFLHKMRDQWSTMSPTGTREFRRLLLSHRLVPYRGTYVDFDIYDAYGKISEGNNLIEEGQSYVNRGELIKSKVPIDRRQHTDEVNQRIGNQMVIKGKALIEKGEKLIKDGERLIEGSRKSAKKAVELLSIDLENLIERSFSKNYYEQVIQYNLMAEKMGIFLVDMLQYIDLSKEVVYFVSLFEKVADDAVTLGNNNTAQEYYKKSLELDHDNRMVAMKLNRISEEIFLPGEKSPSASEIKTDTSQATDPIKNTESPKKEPEGLIEHNGAMLNARKLRNIQKILDRVYDVDKSFTFENLQKLISPEDKIGTVVLWEVSITGYKPDKNGGTYQAGHIEFFWTTPPEGLTKGSKAKVIGELSKMESRKVGKKFEKFYILIPEEVIFETNPDYVYY